MVPQLLAAIQNVLTAEGDPRSPEQFAADNGIDLTNPPSPPSKEALRGLVEPMLKDPRLQNHRRRSLAEAAGLSPPPSFMTQPADVTGDEQSATQKYR